MGKTMVVKVNKWLNNEFISKINEFKKQFCVDFDIEILADTLYSRFEINVNEMDYIGSGSYGFAYSERKSVSKVIKFTCDNNEVLIAKKLLGYKNKHLADIYGIIPLCNEGHVIVQEKLETNSKKLLDNSELIFEIMYDNDEEFRKVVKNKSINNVIKNKNEVFGEKCGKYCIDIIRSAYKALDECKEKTGFVPEDLHLSNVGLKSNGEIAFFDQTFF